MYKVLTIAGSDCSGGAGIQADLKTIMAHGMYGMSAITAITVQNTTGVKQVEKVEPELIAGQIDAVLEDIPPDAIKIGMIQDAAGIRAVAASLKKGVKCPIVMDTVMVSTSGSPLLEKEALGVYCEELLPLATIITPNLPELYVLSQYLVNREGKERGTEEKNRCLKNSEEIFKQGVLVQEKLHTAVLVKGGHRKDSAEDILFVEGKSFSFPGVHLENANTHGTGCTLSTAIACNLAAALPLEQAVKEAKDYITACIADGMDIGKGNGPLNHLAGKK